MEDVDDDARAVEHLRAGRALEVARLARRDLVVDDHDLRLRRRLRIGSVGGASGFAPSAPSNRSRAFDLRGVARSDDPLPAGDRREFEASPRRAPPAAERVAPLRHRADDLVAERLH